MPLIRSRFFLLFATLFAVLLLCTSCYHKGAKHGVAATVADSLSGDSLNFERTHHYNENYNFIVKSDSLVLLKQQPEEMLSRLHSDSVTVYKHQPLVVADIRMLPADDVDSVWVQVARDQHTFGWIHEIDLLPNVVPDDPISQFIMIFSNTHLLVFFIIISLISVYYIMRKLLSASLPIVHFRDIASFYPTLLVLLVAASASFYASIQMFAPDVWQHFYFHPTLNPFSVSLPLGIFLASVWAILLVGLAAVDDVRHLLPFGDALLYLCGLAAVCALNYIIFSISTLYYIGYPLLAAYIFFALRRYFALGRLRFVCGNCGASLRQKTRCPRCGALNE